MKKVVVGIISILIVAAIAVAVAFTINSSSKPISEKENINSNSNKVENQQKEQKVGYDIILSNKDITIEKGQTASFDITFTNPNEMSIREYIVCDDQNDIILVKYSDMHNNKISVDVDALRVGSTKILICDYEYPDVKEYVKVNVIETK